MSIIVAFAGGAGGGYLFAILVNNRHVVGAITGFMERAIKITKAISEIGRTYYVRTY